MKKVAILLLVSLYGCTSVPKEQIQTFGQSSEAMSLQVDSLLVAVQERSIQEKLTATASKTSNPEISKNFAELSQLIADLSNKNEFAYQQANLALGAYAKAISSLANAGSQEEIDLAAVGIFNSLNNLNTSLSSLETSLETSSFDKVGIPEITKEQASEVSALAAAATGWYVERKKASAIKEAVITADPAVQLIADELKSKVVSDVASSTIQRTYKTELEVYIRDYKHFLAGDKPPNLAEKRAEIDKLYQRYLISESMPLQVTQATKALSDFKKAHTALRVAAENNDLNSDTFRDELASLKNRTDHFDNLRVLLMSCEGEVVNDSTLGGLKCQEKSGGK